MTYCLGIKVDQGIVMVSDSRTSAGVDNISVYSKMWRFGVPGDRQFVLCSAGNLATTQTAIAYIERDIKDKADPFTRCLRCNSLLDAVAKEKILDRIPPKAKAYCDTFVRCRTCDKIYWKGTHCAHMRRVVDQILEP